MFKIQEMHSRWISQEWGHYFLIALLFAMPISSTAKSILVGLVVATILLTSEYRPLLARMWTRPWCKALLLLCFIALVECIRGPASVFEKSLVLEKYSKLLLLPILAVGFQDKRTRLWAIYAFLSAMFLTSALSILTYTGLIQTSLINPDFVFRNHIMTGMMMAFSAYLCGLLIVQQRGVVRIIYAILIFIYSYQLFVIGMSRTAYVIYFVLMAVLMIQLLTWRQAIAGVFGVLALFALSYQTLPAMHTGINKIGSDWHQFKKEDKNTPIGYRIQFHQFAYDLFKRHPLVGNGTGSFTASFRIEKPVPSWDRRLLEPHSQYWMNAAEFGLIGIASLFIFLGSLLFASLRLKATRPIALGILIIFGMGNLTDSLLFYSGSGYFFILFMALCLGEAISPKTPKDCV